MKDICRGQKRHIDLPLVSMLIFVELKITKMECKQEKIQVNLQLSPKAVVVKTSFSWTTFGW